MIVIDANVRYRCTYVDSLQFFVFSMQGILCPMSYLIIYLTILFAIAGAWFYVTEPKNKWQCKIHCIFFQDRLEKVTQVRCLVKVSSYYKTELQTLFLHKMCCASNFWELSLWSVPVIEVGLYIGVGLLVCTYQLIPILSLSLCQQIIYMYRSIKGKLPLQLY